MTADGRRAGPHNALIDVTGLRVGHHTAVGDGYLTGTTVILAPAGGMAAGVDVRGGGPATHETDLLDPTAAVERIHALVLSGGSAFGLVTCSAVMNELADRRVGLQVGAGPDEVVPLVPGAALFDLGRGGDFRARPVAGFGVAALAAADRSADPGAPDGAAQGCIGAGTGAVTSNLKGGIGTASELLDGGVTVAALAAVNAAGSPIDPRTGELLGAGLLLPADGPPPPIPGEAARQDLRAITAPRPPGIRFGGTGPTTAGGTGTGTAEQGAADPADTTGGPSTDPRSLTNTTLVVVATDATLTKAQCRKLAAVAQNGLARALNPVHTMFDGDTVFGLATGTAGPPDALGFYRISVAGADVVTRAIVRAVLAATTTRSPAGFWPSWADVVAGSVG